LIAQRQPRALVGVVGDVGQQVRGPPVAANDDAVHGVAEARRGEPRGDTAARRSAGLGLDARLERL